VDPCTAEGRHAQAAPPTRIDAPWAAGACETSGFWNASPIDANGADHLQAAECGLASAAHPKAASATARGAVPVATRYFYPGPQRGQRSGPAPLQARPHSLRRCFATAGAWRGRQGAGPAVGPADSAGRHMIGERAGKRAEGR
jgi:hypothetical protein